jgi:hypothetical protein
VEKIDLNRVFFDPPGKVCVFGRCESPTGLENANRRYKGVRLGCPYIYIGYSLYDKSRRLYHSTSKVRLAKTVQDVWTSVTSLRTARRRKGVAAGLAPELAT